MKREIPILIVFITGILMIAQFFIPHYPFDRLRETFLNWAKIIGAFAMFLGVGNLLYVHFTKISRKYEGWPYSIVLIIALLVTAISGVWEGTQEKKDVLIYAYTQKAGQKKILKIKKFTEVQLTQSEFKPKKTVATKKENNEKVIIQMGTLKIPEKNGKFILFSGTNAAKREIRILPDGKKIIKLFIKQITIAQWIYNNLIEHLSSTMFSLLAFFIASAAFRAFRARTFEALLLLLSAFIVMLGRVPIGASISRFFPVAQDWIMTIPNTAGQRAILIGAAIGAVAISIKIIVGIERSYFGGE